MVAIVRPGSWNFPLFLHLLGAFVLVGGLIAVAVLALQAWRRDNDERLRLWPLAFRTMLLVVLPGWLVMRVAGQWLASRENLDDVEPGWLDYGFFIGDAGLVVLLVLTALTWWSARRGAAWAERAAAVLAPVYLVALAVAWWAMTTKPD